VRLIGDRIAAIFALDGDLDGEAKVEVDAERGKPASSRLAAKSTESSTKRACSPKLRTFVAVSLFAPARGGGADAALVDEDWVDPSPERVGTVCALSAERICAGETTGGGVLSGFESKSADTVEAEVAAISIAPLSTSNNDRTSPVCASIFFASNVSVGSGRNLFIFAFTLQSSLYRELKRVCKISSSCA
jgi:hypothetical protein